VAAARLCHIMAKQVPAFELCECLIDSVCYGDGRTGFPQVRKRR